MKRILRGAAVFFALVVAGLSAGGCSKEEPTDIGEARQSREGSYRQKWAAERVEESARASEAANNQTQPPAMEQDSRRTEQSMEQQYPQSDETSTEQEDEAEADRDMPGKYH